MNFLRRSKGLVLVSALTAIDAFAQTPTVLRPAFEVAAIRASATSSIQAMIEGSLVGIEVKSDRVRVGHMILSNLILTAYSIKSYQLEGPDWLVAPGNSNIPTAFDIEAKLPAGATADQVPSMLQSLLTDRFKLTIRRGSKDLETFALIVAKSGPKFQKKESFGELDGSPTLDSGVSGTKDQKGNTIVVVGGARMTIGTGGTVVRTATLAGLTDALSMQMSLPVVNKTELQGNFDIKVEVLPTDLSGLRSGGTLDVAELGKRKMEQWSIALEKLGLKLVQQKNPIETIIVEHVEKAPTEN